MGKWKLRAALLALVVVIAGPAQAGVVQTLLKADTLYAFCADSSAIINTNNYARMWIDIIGTRRGTADTLVVLAISARRHLSRRMITASDPDLAATYSDSSVVDWIPRNAMSPVSITVDSTSSNITVSSMGAVGSNEIRVILRPSNTLRGNNVLQRWTATVDLTNFSNGMPFRSHWSSFKWRIISAPGSTSGACIAALRVVLNGETW
jgi:hypothetical protein